jgi:hypothetical protein
VVVVCVSEAGINTQEIVRARLSADDLTKATALYARKSLLDDYALSGT